MFPHDHWFSVNQIVLTEKEYCLMFTTNQVVNKSRYSLKMYSLFRCALVTSFRISKSSRLVRSM